MFAYDSVGNNPFSTGFTGMETGHVAQHRPTAPKHFERIPDTAENIAKALMATKPKEVGEWKYMRKEGSGETSETSSDD